MNTGKQWNDEYDNIRKKVATTFDTFYPKGVKTLGSGVVNSTSQYRGKGVVKATRELRGKGVVNSVSQYRGGSSHETCPTCRGSGLFDFLKNIPIVGDIASMGENLMGNVPIVGSLVGSMMGHGKPRKKRTVSPKMQERNSMIRALMQKEGLTLPQASKYLKENGF